MSKVISVLRIEPIGRVTRIDIDDGLASMQAQVGGYIEMVHNTVLHPRAVGIINEEGKIEGLPYNEQATLCFDWMGPPGSGKDFIVGVMILCFLSPADGELESYPRTKGDTVGTMSVNQVDR